MVEKPAKIDVLFGRDSDSWNHEGNRNFRALVVKYQDKYHATQARSEKVSIVANIVGELKKSGAKFLKRDNDNKMWFEVNRKACIEKVGHAIRDKQVITQRMLQKRRSLFESAKGMLTMKPLLCGYSNLPEFTTYGNIHLQNSIVQDVLAARIALAGKKQNFSNMQSDVIAAATTRLGKGKLIANDLVNTESLIVAALQEQNMARQLKTIRQYNGFLASALSTQRQQPFTSTTGLAQLQQLRRRLSTTNQLPTIATPPSSFPDAALGIPIVFQSNSMPLQRAINETSLKNMAPSFLQCYK